MLKLFVYGVLYVQQLVVLERVVSRLNFLTSGYGFKPAYKPG